MRRPRTVPGVLGVAIVDDDPWVRTDRAAALTGSGRVRVVFVGDHTAALDREGWDDVDILVVDAHDPSADFDQFIGVRVVERIRRERTADQLRVLVLTGHVANDMLRIRMAEAGADLLHPHADVRTVEDLLAAIEACRATPAPGPPGDSPVNDAVRWAETHLGAESLDLERSQKALPVSRRRLITARQRIGTLGRVPARPERRLPEWREVARFLQRARGADRRLRD